ncbi:hypothetical protein PGT21_034093 [Puccinia graminis f. sp. tritici]|uniref:Uncharacterized protein n=1 Tax=Puccinia graminis f. sp. tritici TaxID=56615 RepID=A0A5B0PZN1_PUCGR|nr:hypothetical protein PGT21_034093 [Puccinia graminis f. sp. tritici]KAA1109431.1 hypothetical protein PGTUg99_033193 [Puccinia graminis f. sp. tritici]
MKAPNFLKCLALSEDKTGGPGTESDRVISDSRRPSGMFERPLILVNTAPAKCFPDGLRDGDPLDLGRDLQQPGSEMRSA